LTADCAETTVGGGFCAFRRIGHVNNLLVNG